MKKILLVKYGEIAMRGKNRYLFENKLIMSIKQKLDDKHYYIKKEQGRFLIQNDEGDVDYDYLIPRVINTLGVAAVCLGIIIEDQSIENLEQIAVEYMKENYGDNPSFSFKVDSKRALKSYPMQSGEISSRIGGYLLDFFPNLRVDVHNPEVRLTVELRNSAYMFLKVIKGLGGLPAGSSGKGLVLLSGGIDSPVAAFMMAKRGVEIEAVYFHSPPYTSERAKQKVLDLAECLSGFTGGVRLHVIRFTDIQLFLKERVAPEKLTILLKRAMLRTAEELSKTIGAQALILGDSVGQVASQTMRSINAINSAALMPVLRPLCGFDKQEIVDLAVKIGTYNISIRPYEDCCTIFVADHPETKPKTSIIESIEGNFIELLKEKIEQAVQSEEVFELPVHIGVK